MVQIAVCDDSALDREFVVQLLGRYFAENQITYQIDQFESGVQMLYEIQGGYHYSIVFLDIYMGEALGIEVAHRLREINYHGNIVFLTSSTMFAMEGYSVQACGYLLKPVSYQKISALMDRVLEGCSHRSFAVRCKGSLILIPLQEIVFFESCNTRCILHRKDGNTYALYRKLNDIEQEVEGTFFLRTHQSYLVNMNYVKQVTDEFELTTGDSVPIRKRDLSKIRKQYLKYMEIV